MQELVAATGLNELFCPAGTFAVLEQTYLHSKSVVEAKGVSALRDRILAEVRKKPGRRYRTETS